MHLSPSCCAGKSSCKSWLIRTFLYFIYYYVLFILRLQYIFYGCSAIFSIPTFLFTQHIIYVYMRRYIYSYRIFKSVVNNAPWVTLDFYDRWIVPTYEKMSFIHKWIKRSDGCNNYNKSEAESACCSSRETEIPVSVDVVYGTYRYFYPYGTIIFWHNIISYE